MNNNINIADILRDCPKGTKLYSSLFGEVELQTIDNNLKFPILTEIVNEDCELGSKIATFTKDGTYFGIPNTECVLFPSSEVRDWRRFFKPGDVVIVKDGTKAGVFDKWNNDNYKSFLTSFSIYKDGTVYKSQIHSTNKYHKAYEGQRAFFIKQAEKILNGKYNPETLQVEPVKVEPVKIECSFKPFDKVLVRNANTDKWLPGLFEKFDKNGIFPYQIMNFHNMNDFTFRYCIAYEGNEHLLGTTEPYKEE